jgi:hypothetical protein
LSDLPNPVKSHGMAVVGNQIVVCGGFNKGETTNLCYRLIDPINNTDAKWQNDIENMPDGREEFALATINGLLYALGGSDGRDWPGQSSVYRWSSDLTVCKYILPDLPTGMFRMGYAIIPV